MGAKADANPLHHDRYTDAEAVAAVEASADYTDLTDGGETSLHSHAGGGGSVAWPVGAIFIETTGTNPATTLGYGTWTAFGAGRVLLGLDGSDPDFDTPEETGGAKTHAHDYDTVIAHTHTGPSHAHSGPNHYHAVNAHAHTNNSHNHVERVRAAAAGSSLRVERNASGQSEQNSNNDTGGGSSAMSSEAPDTGYAGTGSTGPGGTGSTGSAGSASGTTDATGNVPPYIVVHMWKRTA